MSKTSNYLTIAGKRYLNQAKDFNMMEFYDPITGIYTIPEQEVNSDTQIRDTIIDMLKYLQTFKENGNNNPETEFALTLSTHINESGEEVPGAYDYVIREVEVFH